MVKSFLMKACEVLTWLFESLVDLEKMMKRCFVYICNYFCLLFMCWGDPDEWKVCSNYELFDGFWGSFCLIWLTCICMNSCYWLICIIIHVWNWLIWLFVLVDLITCSVNFCWWFIFITMLDLLIYWHYELMLCLSFDDVRRGRRKCILNVFFTLILDDYPQ